TRFPGGRTWMAGLSDQDGTAKFTYYEGAAAMSSRYADPERDHEIVKSVLTDLGVSEEDADARIEGAFDPEVVTCELVTLSSVIENEGVERIDLLKIDVERAELDVLRGIEPDHWPRIRQVVAEAHDEGGRLDELRQILESQGLRVTVDQEANMKDTGVVMVYASRS
ncbi:MAG: FkbM family methyltransferase, partial [Solirubrobacterales bacterium]